MKRALEVLREDRAANTPPPDMPSIELDAGDVQTRIIATLRSIHDPEIHVNIYDLGLIYAVDCNGPAPHQVHIRMTLTAPACPVAGEIVEEVRRRVAALADVATVEVELVWDPPWSSERMSEAAQLELGVL